MKRYFTLLVIVVTCNLAKSQVDTLKVSNDSILKSRNSFFLYKIDSNFKRSSNLFIQDSLKINEQFEQNQKGILDPFIYNKFLDEKFTYLSFERGVLPSANSASLDLLDNETQLKLTIAKKFLNGEGRTNTIISAGVNAKLGDGISELFKGNVATTGTTLFLNFASLNKVLFRTVISRQKNRKSIPTPFGIMLIKLEELKNNFYDRHSYEFNDKYERLSARLAEILKQIESGKTNSCCCEKLRFERGYNDSVLKRLSANYKETPDSQLSILIKTYSLRMRQLESEICLCDKEQNKNHNELYREKDDIEKQLTELGLIGKSPEEIAKESVDKYEEDRLGLYAGSAPWDWYKLSWFSGGITYTRDAYTTYDNTLSLSKRFGSKEFDSWGLKVTYNWYQEKSQNKGLVRAWYANISYAPSLLNSYSDINAQDILKNVVAANVVDTTYIFQTSKKAKDISNIPYTTSWAHSFSSAFTVMFFEKKNVGINLLFQSQVSKISKPIFNSRAGFIFSLNNSDYDPEDKKSKVKVNFELFLQFPDMSDTGQSGKSVWQKRVIGISTNIPFNKIFLK